MPIAAGLWTRPPHRWLALRCVVAQATKPFEMQNVIVNPENNGKFLEHQTISRLIQINGIETLIPSRAPSLMVDVYQHTWAQSVL
jgi:hypothetical protein